MKKHKIYYFPFYLWFKIIGIVPWRWNRLAEEFTNDFLHYRQASLKQKIWAYRRGFLSERIQRYGLTNENYKKFISDIQFYKKTSYQNQRFVYWFDDKITTWYILQPFVEYLPIHYYSIEGKKIRKFLGRNVGFDNSLDNSIEGILQLLEYKNELALKQSRGGHGRGFFKISCNEKNYFLNNEPISLSDLRKLIESLNGYVITEYVYASAELRKVYNTSPCVMRMVTIYDEEEGAQLTGAYIRFGASKSGLIVDIEGIVYCGIDICDGSLFDPVLDVGYSIESCKIHPDTGVIIEGKVKNWGFIVEKIIEISNYLNKTPYLTYDVIPTDEDFKILEINSHGITRTLQHYYPFFDNKYQRKLFLQSENRKM